MKLLFLLLILPLINGERIVTTTNGPVRGVSLASKKIEAFLGIPYAEPPVGPLRFAKPVPKSSWEEIYEAKKLPPTCVQAILPKSYCTPDPDIKMKEDCLYLNIWVPEGGSAKKPIMLYIHAGGLMLGSSNIEVYDGAKLSAHGDVIVVTINYRLGALGFFSGSTEEAPGSMGMYDQVMAIQWIKDNAENFGGDPDNIVLFGESAGGYSVSMHLVSPLSKNLFKRAILQSGTSINPMFYEENDIDEMSQMVANFAGCADGDDSLKRNPKGIIDCMKALPPEKFSEADGIFLKKYGFLTPTIGDEFLPESTIDILKKGNFKDSEILIGVTRDEGPFLLAFLQSDFFGLFEGKGNSKRVLELNKDKAEEFVRSITKIHNREESENIFRGYFDRVKKESKYTYLDAAGELVGDFLITCGAVFQADYHSLGDSPVYFYLFDYRPASSPLPEWMGVAHFDEVQYVFGNPIHQEFTEYEEELSGDLMDTWVAFARTGNPNIPGGVKWPRYTYQDPKYVIIGKNDKIGIRPDNNRCELWRDVFRSVIDENTIHRLKN